MLSYHIQGISNGFRLGTSLPHEFSPSLENVVNKVFGSFVSNSVRYKLSLSEPVLTIQKISLVVEKATNGFFISVGSVQRGFESDIEAIKYFCSQLVGFEFTEVELVQNLGVNEQAYKSDIHEALSTIRSGLEDWNTRLQEEPIEEKIEETSQVEEQPAVESVAGEEAVPDFMKPLEQVQSVSQEVDGVVTKPGGREVFKSRLVSILAGDEDYQLRPGEKDLPAPPLEKRRKVVKFVTIPERQDFDKKEVYPKHMDTPEAESDVAQVLREVVAKQPPPFTTKRVPDPHCLFDRTAKPEFVEKVAAIVNDLDVSNAQPLTPEEVKEAEDKLKQFRVEMQAKTDAEKVDIAQAQ
jgi:hypothetical protein